MQFKDNNHNLAPPRATDPGWAHGTMVNGEVPDEVKVQIQQHLGFKVLEKLRKHKEANCAKNSFLSYFQDKEGDDEDNDDAGPLQKMAIRRRGKEVLEGTSKRTKRRRKQYLPMTVPVVARPLLQNLASQESIDQADIAVARFMYEAGVPLSAANSCTFQQMADSIAAVGPGYKMPSYNALRGRLLNRSVQDAGEYCTELRKSWEVTGCSVLVDRWMDRINRTKDEVKEVLAKAKKVTRFIYNNARVLNLMRKKTGGRDIIQLSRTRFASIFLTLQTIVTLKGHLEQMFTSNSWMQSSFTKQRAGIEVAEILVDQLFWSMCEHALNVAKPLLSVLHLMDCEDRPSMGYVYDAMEKAKKSIIAAFDNMESDYASYLKIIDHVWQEEFHSPLHAAANHLNPAVFYNANFSFNKVIQKGLLDCIETIEPSLSAQVTITSHIKFYEEAVGDFGRPVALHGRESLVPATWWSLYAADYPDLQRLAFLHNFIRRAEATKSRCMRNNIDPTCLEAMDANMGDWVEDLEEDLSWMDVTVTTEEVNHEVQNTDDSNSNESTDDRSSDLTKGLDGDDDL
ncbi:hypothetical protein POTOM_029028 [Populus tomentosa]|uniref:DUF659 domain-containing protein n=1 Tax=Populus tomentosa TaxID=118781 RepID=A0A8X7Z885_POPTO|nr:hypothetical protein POTOM_029028 [Populus tomentosa]